MSDTYNVPAGYKLVTDSDYERFKKAGATLKELALYLPDEWLQQPQKAKEFFAKIDEQAKETEELRRAYEEREQQYQQLVLQNRIREFSEKYNVDPLFIDKEKFAQLKEEQEIEQYAQEALQKQNEFLAKFGVQVGQSGQGEPQQPPPTPPGIGPNVNVAVQPPDVVGVMDSLFGSDLKLKG